MNVETIVPAGTEPNTSADSKPAEPTLLGGDPKQTPPEPAPTDPTTQTDTPDAGKEGEDPPYEFKLPEGVELDKEALALFEPVMKGLKLPGEHAQKLVDAYSKLVQAQAEKHAAEWRQTQEKWVDEIKNDPQLGGQNFDRNVQDAVQMIRQYGDDELRAYLDRTGLGDYPPLIRMMMRLGRAAAEDVIHRGSASTSPKAPEEVMYPTMTKT